VSVVTSAPSRPDGLVYVADALTVEEEASLLEVLGAMELDEVRMHGVVARRTVRHFGYRYTYGARTVEPGEPLPVELEWVRARAALIAGIEPATLAEILVTRYPPGASIGWHRDAPMFGSKVIGVSLGAPCRMRFRRTGADGAVLSHVEHLAPRSVYVIGGSARWAWQHHIPPTKDLRYSITFRSLRRPKSEREREGDATPR
jgi:alkylated DNA repair dioxygenase AlkB